MTDRWLRGLLRLVVVVLLAYPAGLTAGALIHAFGPYGSRAITDRGMVLAVWALLVALLLGRQRLSTRTAAVVWAGAALGTVVFNVVGFVLLTDVPQEVIVRNVVWVGPPSMVMMALAGAVTVRVWDACSLQPEARVGRLARPAPRAA